VVSPEKQTFLASTQFPMTPVVGCDESTESALFRNKAARDTSTQGYDSSLLEGRYEAAGCAPNRSAGGLSNVESESMPRIGHGDMVVAGRRISLVVLGILVLGCLTPVTSAPPGTSVRSIVDARGVTMLLIPTGRLLMGDSTVGRDEQPVHGVHVSAFYLDETEVRYCQFKDFLTDRSDWCRGAANPKLVDADYLKDWDGTTYPPGLDNHPVVWVSWAAATAYAEWRDARLPTEAEWEFAARGTDARPYPWGSTPPDSGGKARCRYKVSESGPILYPMTVPVRRYREFRGPFGHFGLAGNVWEWVSDWHDPDYYAESPEVDPSGPVGGTYRVLRGGSWSVPAEWVRSSIRLRAFPTRSSDQVGFRCARTVR
jgi:formylglycine-generating enzyme required for sulfatase activity